MTTTPSQPAKRQPSLLLPILFLALFVGGVVGLFIPQIPFKPDVGFEPEALAAMDVVLSPGAASSDLVQTLKSSAGIQSMGATSSLPFESAPTVTIIGDAFVDETPAFCHLVTSDYFRAMNDAILMGRSFTPGDYDPSATVVVLSASADAPLDPAIIGRTITIAAGSAAPYPAIVIGAVRAIAHKQTTARTLDLYLPDRVRDATCAGEVSRQRTIVARGAAPGVAERALNKASEMGVPSIQILEVTSMNERLIAAGLRTPPNTAFAIQTGSALVVGLTGFVISMIRRRRAA